MFAPEGHIAFKDAAEHLKELFAYHDPEDLILDLWSMIEGLPIKAATSAGNLLEPGLADLEENVSRPRGVYSLTDNGLIDVWDGRILAGDFKGCMIVIPKKAWSNYIKGREGQPLSKGGRPSKQDAAREAYRTHYPDGHGDTSWKAVAKQCGYSSSTIQRAVGLKK